MKSPFHDGHPINPIMVIAMGDYLSFFLLTAGVLTSVVGIWVGIYVFLTPRVKEPDGRARLTGTCGDTMEICLKFVSDKVSETSYWTSGCAWSLNCIAAAADLAQGKSPDQLIDIDASAIGNIVGGLPRDHMHCAFLAEETLHTALEDYMLKSRNKS